MGKKSDTERLKRITYNTKVICTLRSLEKGTATHSSILAWRIPRTVWYGVAESDTTEQLTQFKAPSALESDCSVNVTWGSHFIYGDLAPPL